MEGGPIHQESQRALGRLWGGPCGVLFCGPQLMGPSFGLPNEETILRQQSDFFFDPGRVKATPSSQEERLQLLMDGLVALKIRTLLYDT